MNRSLHFDFFKFFKACIVAVTICYLRQNCMADVFDEASPKELAKWRLANQAAGKRLFQDLKTLSKGRSIERVMLIDLLSTKMRQNLSGHRIREESRALCKTYARESRWESLNSYLEDAITFAEQQTNLPITKQSVLGKVETDWSGRVEEAIGEFITVYFDELFDVSRNREIAIQRQEIAKSIQYPDWTDLDLKISEIAQARGGDIGERLELESFVRLKDWLETNHVKKDIVVFQEVEHDFDTMIDKMVFEIKSQYDQQYGILVEFKKESELPRNLITRASIRDRIVDRLNQHMRKKEQAKREQGPWADNIPVYDIFTLIKEQIEQISAEVERERYINFIKSRKVFPISLSGLEKTIKGDTTSHKYPEDSRDILLDYLVAYLKPALAEYYYQSSVVDGIGDTPDDPAYFEKMLSNNPEVSEIYQTKVEAELEKVFSKIRDKIADEQYNTYFSDMAAGEPLSDQAIEKLYFDPERYDRDTFSGAIYVLSAAGKTDLLAKVPLTSLLEETEGKIINYTNDQLEKGFGAFTTQAAIVRDIEKQKFTQLLKDVFNKKPYTEILDEWSKDLRHRWTIQNKDPSYDHVFDWTEKMLNKSVRQFYTHKDIPRKPFIQFFWENKLFTSQKKKAPKGEDQVTTYKYRVFREE